MTNSTPNPMSEPAAPKRLVRSDDRMLAGVCSGVADYLGVDATVVRVVVVLAALIGGGLGIPLYLAGWLLMPDSSGNYVINWRGPSRSGSDTHEPPAA